jgi:hypothetical protein
MATTTTNFGWDIPQSTDLVKDGATAIAALGQDIDTAFVDLKGGTTGQVLAKASGTDLDFSWVAQDDSNAIQNAIVDAKGDLIAATAADTPARLAVGTNGQVLTADSTAATGLKWATPTAATPALTLITRQAYTSALTINVDNVFSSTYDNYKVIIKNSAGNIPGLSMRLRVSSADNTTSNYNSTNIEAVSGTTNAFGRYVTSATSFMNTAIAFTGTSFITFDITSPNLTETTSYAGLNGQNDGGFRSGTFSGLFDATTSFTGFSLYGASGTATGVVTVYGYQKS